MHLPELPEAKRKRLVLEYGIGPDTAEAFLRDKAFADYFEAVVSELRQHDKETPEKPRRNLIKTAVSILTGDFLRFLGELTVSVSEIRITPEDFAELAVLLAEDKISNLAAKDVLREMFRSGEDPSDIVGQLGLWQISDVADLENIVGHIIQENPRAVEDYKKGKEESLQFLVGRVMKESRGKANPKAVAEIIKQTLD